MEKKEIRNKIAGIRERLTEEYMESAGNAIAAKVIESKEFKNAKTVFTYVSMEREPKTDEIINSALKLGKTVCVPKCVGKRNMIAVRIKSLEDLALGSYGILEPKDCSDTIEKDDIDLGIIPCISASPDGRRIGHGGGYYDVFLEDSGFVKMCICFGKLICDDIPMDKYDRMMDVVVTE